MNLFWCVEGSDEMTFSISPDQVAPSLAFRFCFDMFKSGSLSVRQRNTIIMTFTGGPVMVRDGMLAGLRPFLRNNIIKICCTSTGFPKTVWLYSICSILFKQTSLFESDTSSCLFRNRCIKYTHRGFVRQVGYLVVNDGYCLSSA